jgi:hypothetical protein
MMLCHDLRRDSTNLYWIASDYPASPRTSFIRTMAIAGGAVSTLFSTNTAAIASIAVDETNVYFVESSDVLPAPRPRILGALRKDGTGSVRVLAQPEQLSCCLQLAGGSLFWMTGVLDLREFRRTDIASGTTTVFLREGRLLVDASGAIGLNVTCATQNVDTGPCSSWLSRLPSGEMIAYADKFFFASTMDENYVYWVPGGLELRRVRR